MQIETTMKYHLIPVRMLLSKRQEVTCVVDDVEKRLEIGTPLLGIQISAATMENNMEVPQKNKNTTII